MTDPSVHTYLVRGMSCEHCRDSVSEEVSAIPGVEEVAVELASGRLEVTGAGISEDTVRAAVEKAGYELASS